MSKRIVIKETDPNAYKAMAALEKYMAGSQLSDAYKELIKIRASQINAVRNRKDEHPYTYYTYKILKDTHVIQSILKFVHEK